MLTGPELKPRSNNKPKRLVILFHGLGADGNNLMDLASVMNRFIHDTHFIAPNAPFPFDLSMSGHQWFSRQNANEENAIKGLKLVEPMVNEFVDYQLNRFSLTEKDLVAIGFSQGTMVALHTFLRKKNPIALIVGFSGALIAPQLLDSEMQSKPPVLLLHGEDDTVLPVGLMLKAKRELRSRNVSVTAQSYPNLAHSIGKEGFELAIDKIKSLD